MLETMRLHITERVNLTTLVIFEMCDPKIIESEA